MFLALAFSLAFSLQANHIVIPITIDGKPANALFDTGGGNALDPEFAKRLGLHAVGHGVASGAGEGTVRASHARVTSLSLGEITLRDQDFAVLPMPGALVHGNNVRIDAIVGREVLQKYVTRIDYGSQRLTFMPSADFTYEGSGTAVPLSLTENEAIVRGSIDGLAGSFQIDTGSSASLILTSPFVEAHNLRELYHPAGTMVVGRGVGGYSYGDIARGKQLRLGDFAIDDLIVELSTDKRGAFASRWIEGNVGNDVLQRLTLTLDYAHHMAYFERNPKTAVPTPFNRSGMYVQNDDRKIFDVVSVLVNGPAYDAGLREGDQITAIDGTPAIDVTENAFWQLLRGPPGTRHTFTVLRDGKSSDVSVTLEDVV
ncbi:MAG: aspartyl protease family protein [Candidatus Eremiobacteraeota bacterium]|nr:aspartyl protease family protein [Candidatus Eremiobacteraeota bacterium]